MANVDEPLQMGMTISGSNAAPSDAQPVDRGRRFRFVSMVVGFCLIVAAIFTGLAAFGIFGLTYASLIEMFVGSLVSLATATTLAYITGSVVDYNGGVLNTFTKNNRPTSASAYVIPESKG